MAPYIAVAVVLIATFGAGTAVAQEPANVNDEQAQIHFQSGRLHFERGDYEQALTEFQSAHGLSRRPALLYNIYLCQQSLGQNAAAADTLERYLAEGEVSAEERPNLQARLENLRRRAGGTGTTTTTTRTMPATPTPATPVEPVEPEQQHLHQGFFARITLGFGYVSAGADFAGGRISLTGGSTAGSIGVGWAFWENLAIHIEFWGAAMIGGKLEANGVPLMETGAGTRYDTMALGAGATYWFMPLNLSVSLCVGGAVASVKGSGIERQSDPGFGLSVAVGKEWWVGEDWGVGVLLSLFWLSTSEEQVMPGGGIRRDQLNALVLAIQGSITLN